MTAVIIVLDNFSSFLVFPVSRFHPLLGTGAPGNLPRVTVEGGNRMLGSKLRLLDLTDIWPHLTSCFLNSSLSCSWASSHLAFEQTEMSSYQLSAVMIRYSWELVVCPQRCAYISVISLKYCLTPCCFLQSCITVMFLYPGLFLSDVWRAWSKYLKCWREKKP